jgi:hypothetical protein
MFFNQMGHLMPITYLPPPTFLQPTYLDVIPTYLPPTILQPTYLDVVPTYQPTHVPRCNTYVPTHPPTYLATHPPTHHLPTYLRTS